MKQVYLQLPPFAPDYSGVCSALFELGGMIIIHDACGCTGNYTGFDEPRWYGSKSQVYCSVLRQIDAIIGDDEKLIGRILEAAEEMKPKFICITGSPVPMVIGTDFQGLAREVEQRTGLPSFGFATTGLKLYDCGAADAFLALVKRFVKKEGTVPGRINLLGLTPLDFYADSNAQDIKAALEAWGYTIGASIAMGTTLEDIATCGSAQANVVVSQSGLKMAKYMEEQLGIPYVVGVPVGKATWLMKALEQACREGKSVVPEPVVGGRRVLIMGEQVISDAIRRYLMEEQGVSGIAVANIFTPCPEIAGPEDFQAIGEKELGALVNGGSETVIADPMLGWLLKPGSNTQWIDFPIPAVSSKINWKKCVPFIGKKAEALAKQI